MSKSTEIVGIDVSKDTLDVYSVLKGSSSYPNNHKGYQLLLKTYGVGSHYVMESTGSYHHQLVMYLHERTIRVSVVNPLVVKRFIQMKLNRNKTDKSDAKMICHYGEEQVLDLWEPNPEYVEQSKDIYTTLDTYLKQQTALKNKLHSLSTKGVITGILVRSLKRQLKHLKTEISCLEEALKELMKEHQNSLYTRLKSVPGIGDKTAMLLIVSTNGFKDFESDRQVSSYFGLAPTERTSGSSIRGRSRISKVGNKQVRNHLFLCSFTASYCNPQCKALYERLVNKGKSKKLALIAVANKLIKQSYGIAKSGLMYDPNYRSVLIRE